jgi:hypothetical protein
MRPPKSELGLVKREKILGCLLNRAHRYGLTGDEITIAGGPDR